MKTGVTTSARTLAFLFESGQLNNASTNVQQDTSIDADLALKAAQRQAEDAMTDQATLDLIEQMQREDVALAGPSDAMDPETAALLAMFAEEDARANRYRS